MAPTQLMVHAPGAEGDDRGHENEAEKQEPSFENVYEKRVEVLKRMSKVIKKAQKLLGHAQLQAAPTHTRKRRAARFDSVCASYVVHMNALAMFCLAHERSQECAVLLAESRKLTKPAWGKRCADLRVLTLNNLACMHRASGDCQGAVKTLKEAIKLTRHVPSDSEHLPISHLLLSAALSVLDRHEAAYKQATLAVSLARRTISDLGEKAQLNLCGRRAMHMQVRNLRIAMSLGYYDAAVEADFLGMAEPSREYLRKADDILERRVSWHLEYAVCPTARERALGPHASNESVQRPIFDVLAIEPYYWRLEQDKSLWGDDLFQAWHTVRLHVPQRKGSSKRTPSSPTAALRQGLRRRTPVDGCPRSDYTFSAEADSTALRRDVARQNVDDDNPGLAVHSSAVRQVRALRQQKAEHPAQDHLVEQPLLSTLCHGPLEAQAVGPERGLPKPAVPKTSRLAHLSKPKQSTQKEEDSSSRRDDVSCKPSHATPRAKSSKTRSRNEQRKVFERLATASKGRSRVGEASAIEGLFDQELHKQKTHMADFSIRRARAARKVLAKPKVARPQTAHPTRRARTHRSNRPQSAHGSRALRKRGKSPNPHSAPEETLVSTAILDFGDEGLPTFEDDVSQTSRPSTRAGESSADVLALGYDRTLEGALSSASSLSSTRTSSLSSHSDIDNHHKSGNAPASMEPLDPESLAKAAESKLAFVHEFGSLVDIIESKTAEAERVASIPEATIGELTESKVSTNMPRQERTTEGSSGRESVDRSQHLPRSVEAKESSPRNPESSSPRAQASEDSSPRAQASKHSLPRTQASENSSPRSQASKNSSPRAQALENSSPRAQELRDASARREPMESPTSQASGESTPRTAEAPPLKESSPRQEAMDASPRRELAQSTPRTAVHAELGSSRTQSSQDSEPGQKSTDALPFQTSGESASCAAKSLSKGSTPRDIAPSSGVSSGRAEDSPHGCQDEGTREVGEPSQGTKETGNEIDLEVSGDSAMPASTEVETTRPLDVHKFANIQGGDGARAEAAPTSRSTSSCSTFSSAPAATPWSTSSCSTFSSAPSAIFMSVEDWNGAELEMGSSSSCSTFSSAGSAIFMSLDDAGDFPSDPSMSSFSSCESSILSLDPARR